MTTENLDELAAQAAALDVAPDAAAPDAAASNAAAADVPAEVAALLQTVSAMLTPAFPCLAEIYTVDTCRQLGEAAAPVLDKYGLSMDGLFERWGAEITLASVALPVGAATWAGVKADIAARKAPAVAAPATPATPAAPAAPTPAPAGGLVIPSPNA